MSSDDSIHIPPGHLQVIRIIHLGLFSGCVLFGAIAWTLRNQQPAAPVDPPLISYVGAGFALSVLTAFLIVPPLMLSGWRRRQASQPDPDSAQTSRARNPFEKATQQAGIATPYLSMYQTHFLIRAALLESVVFYFVLAFQVEGHLWTLGVAGIFLLGLLVLFPTEAGIRRWVSTQRDAIDLMRRTSA